MSTPKDATSIKVDSWLIETHINRCQSTDCDFNSWRDNGHVNSYPGAFGFCSFKKVGIGDDGKCDKYKPAQA